MNVIFCAFFILIVLDSLFKGAKTLAMNSKSKNLKLLRKFFWTSIKDNLIPQYTLNHKVKVYLENYVENSIAIKRFFINNGYKKTRFILTHKLEEIERFVDKYKYNTFDNITDEEEDFINKFLKKDKK